MIQDRRCFEGAHQGAHTENHAWQVLGAVPACSGERIIPARLEAMGSDRSDSDNLRWALRKLEAQQRQAAYLMAAAGHDLRQPLQIIAMALEALAQSRLTQRQHEWLAVAIDEISNLSAGLTDLAIAARLSDPERTRVPLCDVLALAAESWRRHAMARGLELRIRRTDLVVRSDPRLLTTILRNLVGNAVKHTLTGGIIVACRPRAEDVRIDVIDTGPGLPIGALADGFEPHRRGEANVEGLGMGLAIVRDAVERVGCTLSVQTTEGRGTRFSLMIPRGPSPHGD
jgi:signal transduction histidine kinase